MRVAHQGNHARDRRAARLVPRDWAELCGGDNQSAAHAAPPLSSSGLTRESVTCISTFAPAQICSGVVNSSMLWLRPAREGPKIIAVGQFGAHICAS